MGEVRCSVRIAREGTGEIISAGEESVRFENKVSIGERVELPENLRLAGEQFDLKSQQFEIVEIVNVPWGLKKYHGVPFSFITVVPKANRYFFSNQLK